jgi:hypothetical protein
MLSLLQKLNKLRSKLASAAQEILNEWVQDEEGLDEVFGGGGPCDRISEMMANVIGHAIDDAEILDGGHEGDDHAWLIVVSGDEVAGVDIPSDVYETGGGYSWAKIQDVQIQPEDVVIWSINKEDVLDRIDTSDFEQIATSKVSNLKRASDVDEMRLQPGPAFHLQPDGTWAVEDAPSIVVQNARYSGRLTIEGYLCAVFELNGEEWAQKLGPIEQIASRIAGVLK